MTAELGALSAIAITRQARTGGYTYGRGATLPSDFQATAAMPATSIRSSTLVSYGSGADTFVGMLVEVARCAGGTAGEYGRPLRVKVLAQAGSTLTIEALPFSTASGDLFRLLDDPGGVWSISTGGSKTAIRDATRNETADYWNGDAKAGGPYMRCVKSGTANANTQKLISDYATSTATTATFAASTVVGELYEAVRWMEVFNSGAPFTLNAGRADRGSLTGTFGMQRGVAGVREVSGSPEFAFRGPGVSREGDAPELDDVFGSVMDVTAAPTDETVGTGTTTTSINVTSAVTAGQMFVTEQGDVAVATTSADPMVPSPNLRIAPATGTTLYGMRTWTPASDSHENYCLKAIQWHGLGVKDEIVGLLPNIQFSGERGALLKVTCPMTGADGYRVYLDETGTAISRTLNPILPSVTPRAIADVRVCLDGTEFEARSFTLDMGFEIALETNLVAPNQAVATLRKDAPNGKLSLYLDTDAKATIPKWIDGKPCRLLIQVGTTPGDPGVFAFWANEIEIVSHEIGDDNGAITLDIGWRATVDTTSTLPRWIVGVG